MQERSCAWPGLHWLQTEQFLSSPLRVKYNGPGQGIWREMLQAEDKYDHDMVKQTEDSGDEEMHKHQSIDLLSQARVQARQAINLPPTSHPNVEQVARLRAGYSDILRTLKAERQSLIEPQNDRLAQLIEQANELHMQVQRTVDAALDARVMAATADLGVEKLHSLPQGTNPFTVNDLSNLLRKTMKSSEFESLVQIGKIAALHWHGVVGMETTVGLFDSCIVKKPRNAKARRIDDQSVGPIVSPSIVTTASLQNQPKETTDLVIEVYEQLENLLQQQEARVSLFRVVCDPNSFGRSVELLFYISFLVADNRLTLHEESGELYISLNPNPNSNAIKRQRQIVCLSVKGWRETVDKFAITEAMIK